MVAFSDVRDVGDLQVVDVFLGDRHIGQLMKPPNKKWFATEHVGVGDEPLAMGLEEAIGELLIRIILGDVCYE